MTYRSIAFPESPQSTRGGLVTICVLTCLLVAASLAMIVMQTAIRERREVSLRHQMLQTDFLLDAGVQLARSRITESSDYQGETWIPDTATTEFPNARVVIQLSDDNQTFEVIASLGTAPENEACIAAHQTRRSYKLSTLPTTNVSE